MSGKSRLPVRRGPATQSIARLPHCEQTRRRRHSAGIGAAQPGAEIIPEGEAELGAGFGEAEKGIAAIAPAIAAGAAADLALGHLAADGVFSAVGVQRDVRPIEGPQQLGFVGVEAGEQPIEGSKAGAALEDTVETGAQGGSALWCRISAVGLEVAVEPPDQRAHVLLRDTLPVGEGIELVDQAFGMDPTQGVAADRELAGIVADQDGIRQEAVGLDAAPQCPLGGDQHGSGVTVSAVMPSRSRCACQAAWSAKCWSGCAAKRWITGPARLRLRM